MRYQLWEDTESDGPPEGLTLIPADRAAKDQARGLLGVNPVLILEFEARTWEEAAQRMYDHYGWGTYRPMDRDDEAGKEGGGE